MESIPNKPRFLIEHVLDPLNEQIPDYFGLKDTQWCCATFNCGAVW